MSTTDERGVCDFGCQVELGLPSSSKIDEVESDSSSDSYGMGFLFHLQDRLSSKSTSSDDCSTISQHSRRSSLVSENATEESFRSHDVLDQLLQRTVNERLSELQRISERHISTGNARRNLESFFEQGLQNGSQSSARRTTNSLLGEPSDNLGQLFQRLANERRSELARLHRGDRLVPLSNARDNLESFFQSATQGTDDAVDSHDRRPSQVTNDVQNLRQQNLVQAALQSGSFRMQLERTLGGRLTNTVSQRPGNQQSPRVPRPPISSHEGASAIDQRDIYRGHSPTLNSSTSARGQPNRRSHVVADAGSSQAVGNLSRPNVLEAHIDNFSNQNRTIQNEMELLAHTISEDISSLEGLQIVNNMLRTDFRNRLENLIQDRVQAVGNGAAVQEFIQSLPGTRSANPNRAGSNNSQYRSARSQHMLDNSVAVEMQGLRQQLDEMKRMVSVSFELQIDTQRIIRQEVSAVFNAFMQDYLIPKQREGASSSASQVTGSASSSENRNTPAASGKCIICTERNVDSVLYQCGHMCVCLQCGIYLNMEGHKCPMCRAPIRDVIRAYQTQDD